MDVTGSCGQNPRLRVTAIPKSKLEEIAMPMYVFRELRAISIIAKGDERLN